MVDTVGSVAVAQETPSSEQAQMTIPNTCRSCPFARLTKAAFGPFVISQRRRHLVIQRDAPVAPPRLFCSSRRHSAGIVINREWATERRVPPAQPQANRRAGRRPQVSICDKAEAEFSIVHCTTMARHIRSNI